MMSFVERFRAKASKARQAQSRLKALERMERIAPAHVDSPFEFSFLAPQKLPRPLLTLEKQSAGYGERVVLRVTEPDDRARRSHRTARPQRRGQVDADEAAGRRARRARRASAPKRAICASATSPSISSSSSTSTSRRSQHLRRRGGEAAARSDRAGAARLPRRLRLQRRSRVRAGRAVLRRREGAAGAGAGQLTCARTCCCSTSRPTISTSRCARRWRWRCRTTKARSCSSRTIGICCARSRTS